MVLFGGHAWFYLGGAWFYLGGVWFYLGGMHGFIQGGVHGFIQVGCMCGFIPWGHAWFYLGGRAWFFQFFWIQWDTVNEWAVCILLECILVKFLFIAVRNVVAARLCFYRRLWFCWQGVCGRHSPGRTPFPWADTLPLGRHPQPQDGYCSGRYASYWNAFLLDNLYRNYPSFASLLKPKFLKNY